MDRIMLANPTRINVLPPAALDGLNPQPITELPSAPSRGVYRNAPVAPRGVACELCGEKRTPKMITAKHGIVACGPDVGNINECDARRERAQDRARRRAPIKPTALSPADADAFIRQGAAAGLADGA